MGEGCGRTMLRTGACCVLSRGLGCAWRVKRAACAGAHGCARLDCTEPDGVGILLGFLERLADQYRRPCFALHTLVRNSRREGPLHRVNRHYLRDARP